MIRKLSNNISSYLCNELSYDNEKREILSYGLQIFLGTSFKIITILILSYFLKTFASTLVVCISFVFFRRIIGGSHYDTYNKCYTVSVSLTLLLGIIGEVVTVPYRVLYVLIIFTYLISVLITIVWVPMGTQKKTINNRKTRLKIKYKTIFFLTVWIVFLIGYERLFLSLISFSSLLGITLAFFLATPLGSKFIRIIVWN
ncbi:accessory gene regulator B [Anaerovirgula multivorans]|uniref:Accessory gene regulator B n=1 Tax=Anaerovirgula multivorans TaxID=312168 RepID=A0A239KWV3_9FIRM|nr:accessory gene regulator B family protein [Anaerovirgula multivorans]SNT21989.1 accessory gene regulator B [Anaerovirgula multivorans]